MGQAECRFSNAFMLFNVSIGAGLCTTVAFSASLMFSLNNDLNRYASSYQAISKLYR